MSRIYLLVTGDLMLSSQVVATARTCGVAVRPAASDDLRQQLENVAGVLWDLESGLPDQAIVARCQADGQRFLAFGPHVRQTLLDEAQRRGCQPVLPRGQFLRRLAEWLV